MKTLEIDYYIDRDATGLRACVRTTRITVPADTPDTKIPFLLTDKVGKHEGIRRITVVS